MTPAHQQLDLNYTQDIRFGRYRVQLVGDMYNVMDKQTGYNPNPVLTSATFGNFFSYWAPRTFQLTARFKF